MKQVPQELLNEFIQGAQNGMGREEEIGGGNTVVSQTVLSCDVAQYPGSKWLVGGAIRVYLNKQKRVVGHKAVGPNPKRKE
jgi:hypothetical protein